jgi:hypothetical protein
MHQGNADNSFYNDRMILGGQKGWFTEDNTFSFSGDDVVALQSEINEGGGGIARYNTMTGTMTGGSNFAETHGKQPTGIYGPQITEVYGNNITISSAGYPFVLRGGKGIFLYNVIAVNANINLYEEFSDTVSSTVLSGGGSLNSCVENQGVARQTCTDSCICQKVHDTYILNNRASVTGALRNAIVTMDYHNENTSTTNSPAELVENIEFFQDAVSFNGTSGVGCGTVAQMNAIIPTVTGVGFWATNQSCTNLTDMVGVNPAAPISGTLYKWNGSAWAAYYTPYTYPHPLRGDVETKTQYALSVTSANGTVTSNPSDINCGSTCSANYDLGTSVILTASANSGYTFTGWSGGGCSGKGTCTITMTAATPVTANYAITTNNLTVTKSGMGVGTVTGSDSLINCGSTCSVNYESGKAVTLTASANSGSTFSGWSGGGCSGKGTCAVSMTAATTVAATFTPVYNLTVTKSATGAGTITSSDSTINCGSTCSANYNPGTSVTLTAWANSGYTFTGWLGGGCTGTGTCTVSMAAATSVTATFATTTYNLAVTKSGTGSGTVTGSDGLINCGTTCSVNYDSGKSVTLAASATSGSTFSGWSGGCSGTGTCTVNMTAAKSVTANYAKSVPANYTTSVTTNSVRSVPANYGISVTTNYAKSVPANYGTSVTTNSAKSVPANYATPVTTNYATSVTYKLTVSKSGTGSGTVTSRPSGISCGSTCSANYSSKTSVTLAALANSGSVFSGWSGGCSGTGTCTVSMTAAKSVKATFAKTGLYR